MAAREQLNGSGTARSPNKRRALQKRRLVRRKFLKLGAAGGAAMVASLYVSPSFRSIGALPAYAQATPVGSEGCTPGFWKNRWEQAWPAGYDADQLFVDYFAVPSQYSGSLGSPMTLLEALMQGGGCEKALGRHGVAALLNAAQLSLTFGLTEGQVIGMVSGALATEDCAQIESIKDSLNGANEESCPLGGRKADD